LLTVTLPSIDKQHNIPETGSLGVMSASIPARYTFPK